MHQNLWKVNNCSATQEVPRLSWNMKVEISGFCHVVDLAFALLGSHAAHVDSRLLTFGTAYHSHLQGSRSSSLTDWPFKMGIIGCPETSANNHQHKLRNIPEEQRPKHECPLMCDIWDSYITFQTTVMLNDHVKNNLPLVPVLSQMTHFVFKIQVNTVLQSMPRCSKWCLSFGFSNRKYWILTN